MRIFLLSIFFLLSFCLKAQLVEPNNILLEKYTLIGDEFNKEGERDSSLFYYNKAIQLVKTRDDSFNLVSLNQKKAKIFEFRGSYSKAVKLYYIAISNQKNSTGSREIGLCYLGLSNINFRMASNDLALQQGIKAADIFEQVNDTLNFIVASTLIGQVYIGLAKYSEAQGVYDQALSLVKQQGYKDQMGNILNHLGAICTLQGKYDLALTYYRQSFDINEQAKNKAYLGIDYANIGEAYMFKGNYPKALYHLNKAMEIEEKENFNSVLIFVYYALGQTYSRMGDGYKSMNYFTKSLALIDSTNELREKPRVYNLIFQHYERQGNLDKALSYYKKYNFLNDSLNNEANRYKIEEIRIKYEVKKKEQENRSLLLAKKIQGSELIVKNSKIRFQYIVIIIAFVSFIVLMLLINALHIRRKKLRRLVDAKDSLFSIIGHDLRGPIANVNQLVHMLDQADVEESKKIIDMLKPPVDSSLKLLDELLTWASSLDISENVNKEKIFVKELTEDIYHLLQSMMEEKQIEFKNLIPETVQVIANKNHLSTILRNLISNAIKFTPDNGSIKLSHEIIHGKVKIMVSDTGVGIEAQSINKILSPETFFTTTGTRNEMGTGLGLAITQNFLETNYGSFGIKSVVGSGSTFYFTLPLA